MTSVPLMRTRSRSASAELLGRTTCLGRPFEITSDAVIVAMRVRLASQSPCGNSSPGPPYLLTVMVVPHSEGTRAPFNPQVTTPDVDNQ